MRFSPRNHGRIIERRILVAHIAIMMNASLMAGELEVSRAIECGRLIEVDQFYVKIVANDAE